MKTLHLTDNDFELLEDSLCDYIDYLHEDDRGFSSLNKKYINDVSWFGVRHFGWDKPEDWGAFIHFCNTGRYPDD